MNIDNLVFWFFSVCHAQKGIRMLKNNLPNSLISGQTKLPVLAKLYNIDKIFWFNFSMSSSKGYRNAVFKIISQFCCSRQARPLILQHDMNVRHNYGVVLVISSERIKYTKNSMQPTNHQKICPHLFFCILFFFKG